MVEGIGESSTLGSRTTCELGWYLRLTSMEKHRDAKTQRHKGAQ